MMQNTHPRDTHPQDTHPKVLIIGAGPTGMTAALELSRMQIPLRIVEKASEPATTSRAIGVQARTLELFEQRGLAQSMLAKGNPGLAGNVYGDGKRIFRLDFSHNGSRYGYLLVISQAETEAILRAKLQEQQVTIERGVEFLALAQTEHGDAVTAILKHPDGSLEEVTCDYLIDSEGAHSISRSTLNLQFAGKTREEQYGLADLSIDGELSESEFHIFSSESGLLVLFPMGSGHFRLIASNPFPTSGKEGKERHLDLNELQAIYDQRSQLPGRLHDMSWSSWFRINSRMVDRLHAGRVFLGGDSAHIHSPAGGQGMNTGIQDMINLSWKLALVIKGLADPKLLATYDDDRLPVIRDVLAKTEGLTDAMVSENPVLRSVFSHIAPHVAPWIVGTELVQENSTGRMSQISLNYRASPLSVSHHAAGELRAGDRVPDLAVQTVGDAVASVQTADPGRLIPLLSTDHFTLLFVNLADPQAMHASVASQLAPWNDIVRCRGIAPNAEGLPQFRKVFGTGPALILVRPDGYAAFIGSDRSLSALTDYLAAWFPARVPSAKAHT